MLRQQYIGGFQRGMPAAPDGTCAGSASGEAGYAESAAAASRHVSPAICSGVCHGTLGELLQGPYEHDGELHIGLISLPVRKYSWMHFSPGEAGDIDIELAGKDKCRRAIELYLRHYGKRCRPGAGATIRNCCSARAWPVPPPTWSRRSAAWTGSSACIRRRR
ncbi:hypothetical protein [Lysobacter capsici]|uniref:hypothetical protein n=1 Tax=Lysobacter capsici TaxID=435897 RepID=UPI00398D427B